MLPTFFLEFLLFNSYLRVLKLKLPITRYNLTLEYLRLLKHQIQQELILENN